MPYTLLLGETEPHVRHMMAFKLRQAGYAVLVAEDGDAVLEMAKHLAPAAVIIDARLTRGDGTPLHRALASSESTIDLPLVLLVANESEVSEADRAVERLMRILTKPVGPTEVLKALGGMLTPHSAVTGRNSADVAFKRFAI
jgi:DNA-binding response OmpR family regulator